MIMRYKTLEVILDFLKTHKDVTCTPIDADDQIDPCSLRIRCQGRSTLYFAIHPEDIAYVSLSSHHGETMKLSAVTEDVYVCCEGTLDFNLSGEEMSWVGCHSSPELSTFGTSSQWSFFAFRIKGGEWFQREYISRGVFDLERGIDSVADVGGTFSRGNRS